jgi:hypothetical protein
MPDSDFPPLSAKDLNEVCSRTMFTIDGLWFQAVEEKFGFEAAFKLNQVVWAKGSFIHGRRLLKKLNLEGNPPLEKIIGMVSADPMSCVHRPQVTTLTDTTLVLRFIDCPIQVARIKAGRGVYNGKPGCGLYYDAFAKLIDPRIETTCLACAPNPDNPEYWCEWQFRIAEEKK